MKGTMTRSLGLLVGLLALLPSGAQAEVLPDRFSAGGYFRIMTRPDFQGGDSKLGYWNLYGRLLNEGPWGALELQLSLLQAAPGRADPWAAVHAKIEGGSFANTDLGRGNLAKYAATQLYVQAGNILFEHVTWQLGTLWTQFGDLGLYDMRPAEIFFDTVGASMKYAAPSYEVLVGVGDAGWAIRNLNYSTILTAGGTAKLKLKGFELGAGGQYRYEPAVPGNRNAPYQTPGIGYEDYLRHEVVKSWLQNHPGQEDLFPNPVATSNASFKAVGYLGFGGVGPLRWNNLFANFLKLHPDSNYVENYNGRDYTIYVAGLTNERYQVNVGNEMQLRIVDGWLDAVWGVLYGNYWDLSNAIAPGDYNRTFYSTVLRLQLYATANLHLLLEGSLAREHSTNGNFYRQHVDSVFQNDKGVVDSRGLQFGDSDTRDTQQVKGGIILNPNGRGVFTRPSLRLLAGVQHSNQQTAYGNGFVDSLDQFNRFAPTESHWHVVAALEAEAWF